MIEYEPSLTDKEQRRLSRWLASSQSPNYKKRKFTFYRGADSESERRFVLPTLNPDFSSILLDSAGSLYITIWHEAKIGPEYVNFTPTQRGRDLYLEPLRSKRVVRLVAHHFPLGVDITLRAMIDVRDKYRLDGGVPGQEAYQMLAALGRLRKVMVARGRLKELKSQDLVDLVEENDSFLEEAGFKKPRNPEKRKIVELSSRGFYDSKGNRSNIAAISRTFALEYAIRRRLEGAFPPILVKFAAITEVLMLERELTRLRLLDAIQTINEVQTKPLDALDASWKLEGVAVRLWRNIRVRPYLAKARRAAINLGIGRVSDPKWETYRRWRQNPGLHSVGDYLRRGEIAEANLVMDVTKRMLQKVLDTYEDYAQVKKDFQKQRKII